MLIPTKFNGYQAGIRLYPGGGGGGPAAPQTSQEAMGRGPIGDMINKISPGGGGGGSGPIGDMINKISPDTSNTPQFTVDQGPTPFVGPRTPSQVGRTMPGEAPALQPIYKSQYANYTNPGTYTNVSSYGTAGRPSDMVTQAYANIGRTGIGGGANQIDQGGYNYWNQQLASGAMSPQEFGSRFAQGAKQDNPNSPTIQGFINNPSALYSNAGGAQLPQSMYNGVYGGMGGMGGMGGQLPQMQTPFNPYTNSYQSPFSYGGGFQSPFSYGGGAQLPQSMYGGMGGMGGMGQQPQQYMQQQVPQYMQQQVPQYMQQPSAPAAPIAQRTSGPSQPILSRAAMARGTPNVMRRAEGGITSLLDDSE